MARVFISHSSRDVEPAARIKSWLQEQGFETPFLDFDKHAGIPPGADWEKTLYREIEQSEAIIIIQTPNWMDSKWCFAEYTQARALGKAIFPVIEAPTGETLIARDIQALNLLKDREGGLERLSRELTRIALDAQGGFPWDNNRPPYPGLSAFQEEDAALYFGRDDDIRRLIERLNARRAQGGAELIALLGASGSGKSSLLRAGVIPRLKRDRRNWIVLPPMRPQTHPVDELARAITVALKQGLEWRAWRDQLHSADLARTLSDLASDLRMHADANEAQVLIPVDQAEELFGASDSTEASRFFEILNFAASADLPFLTILAQRSDFLEKLQSAEKLTARFEEFSLGPLPLTRIPQIIEGPARVAGLGIDDGLVLQASKDAETEDALPLLAFALRELFDRYGSDNRLTLENYHALGDTKEELTPLENAVRKAADDVLADAKPDAEELNALRDAFVPAMVRVNDKGEYVRRPAQWDDLPTKARLLLERLAKARLLVISQEGDGRMVEVAHEALLRKWPRLREWLDDAREFLTGKQQMERDLHDWDSAAANDKTSVLLTGLKLNRARGWLLERPHQLTTQEHAFIQASIDKAEADERRKVRIRRRTTQASIAASLVLLVVAGFAVFKGQQANESARVAEAAKQRAEEQSVRAAVNAASAYTALARIEANDERGDPVRATKLALAAWPETEAAPEPRSEEIRSLLSRLVPKLLRGGWLADEWEPRQRRAEFSSDGRFLLIREAPAVTLIDVSRDMEIVGEYETHHYTLSSGFSPDGKWFATTNVGAFPILIDLETGEKTTVEVTEEGTAVGFSTDSDTFIYAAGGMIYLHKLGAAEPMINRIPAGDFFRIQHLALSSDGKTLIFSDMSSNAAYLIPDIEKDQVIPIPIPIPIPFSFSTSLDFDSAETQVRAGVSEEHGLLTDAILSWDILPANNATKPAKITLDEAKTSRIYGAENVDAVRLDQSLVAIASTTAENKITVHFSDRARGSVALPSWNASVLRVVISDDATRAAVLYSDSTIHIWDLSNEQILGRHHLPGGPARDAVFLSAETLRVFQSNQLFDSTHVANEFEWRSANTSKVIFGRVFDLEIKDATAHILSVAQPSKTIVTPFWPGGDQVATSHNGEMAAVLAKDKIRIYVPGQSDPVHEISVNKAFQPRIVSLQFSESGRWLLMQTKGVYSSGKGYAVWNFETGKKVEGQFGWLSDVDRMQILPDESQLLVAHDGSISNVSLDDLARPNWTVPGSLPAVVSRDGTRLYTSGNQIKVSDPESAIFLGEISVGNSRWARPLREMPDGRILIHLGDTSEAWNFSSIPQGSAFQVACAFLPDHSWEDVLEGSAGQLGSEEICPEGYDPPVR